MSTNTDRQALAPAPTYDVHRKQREVLESDARYIIQEWGRRGGKNITSVIGRIEHARQPWESPYGTDDPEQGKTWWVGPSYDQAFKYGYEKLKSAVPDRWIESKSRSEPYEITLINGWTFEFRTFDHPETLQGAGVDDLLIDEADYMPDNLWYDDLEPMLMDNLGRLTAISKPVRHGSWFQTLKERGKSPDWDEHFYSHATSAQNPFIEEDPMDKRGTMPDAKFRRQYLAELPDDGGQVFSKLSERMFHADYELLGSLTGSGSGVTGEVYAPEDVREPPFSVGADFAQSRDYRVTLALDTEGKVVYFKRSQNESWGDIQMHLEGVHQRYPGVVVPDATRDNKIISDLWNAGVELEPTKFSKQEKKRLIEDLITVFEQGQLTAPDSPKVERIKMEMRVLEKEVTGSGYSKYHAPESEYDDSVDALALAYRGLESAETTSTTATVGDDEWDGGPTNNLNDVAEKIARDKQRAKKGWK